MEVDLHSAGPHKRRSSSGFGPVNYKVGYYRAQVTPVKRERGNVDFAARSFFSGGNDFLSYVVAKPVRLDNDDGRKHHQKYECHQANGDVSENPDVTGH